MTKRYGRNQKRAHLARIAELEDLLEQADLEQYGFFGKCTLEHITEIPTDAVLSISVDNEDEWNKVRQKVTLVMKPTYTSSDTFRNIIYNPENTNLFGINVRYDGWLLAVLDIEAKSGNFNGDDAFPPLRHGHMAEYTQGQPTIVLQCDTLTGDKVARKFQGSNNGLTRQRFPSTHQR